MILARSQVTLSLQKDISAEYRYYLLQLSTLNPPSVPSIHPPAAPWTDTEPTHTFVNTLTLYTVDCTVYSDGTFQYTPVSVSSSYEAAKEAYNKAVSATNIANAKTAAYYQATQPSGSSYNVNDIWFDTGDGNKMYCWNGSAWVASTFGEAALAAESVTASKIAAGAVTTAAIATESITADKVVAGVIDAGSIHVKDSNNKTVFRADATSKIVKIGQNITANADGLNGSFDGSALSIDGGGILVRNDDDEHSKANRTIVSGGGITVLAYDDSNNRYYKYVIGGNTTANGAIEIQQYRRNPVTYPDDEPIGTSFYEYDRIELEKVGLDSNGLAFWLAPGTTGLDLRADGDIYGAKAINASGRITAGGSVESYGNFIAANNKFLHAHLADSDDTIGICGLGPSNVVNIGHSSYPLNIRSSSIQVTDEAKFREGIGLKPTTVSTTAATVSGVTVSGRTCTKIGNLAIVYLYLTIASGTATFSNWTTILSGLPKAASNHVTNVPPTSSSFARALTVRAGTDGNLAIRYGGPGTFYLTMAYPIT